MSSVTPIMPSVFSPAHSNTNNFHNYPTVPQAVLPAEFTQQPSKGYGRRQCCEVDEDDGSDTLHVQGVLYVTDIVRVAAADVMNQASK